MKTYKLLRLRKDGTLGPLFINRSLVMPIGKRLQAEVHPTKGYKERPGFHSTPQINAPHLTMKGRVWVECDVVGQQYTPEQQPDMFSPKRDMDILPAWGWYYWERPEAQGGRWIISDNIKLIRIVEEEEVFA